MKAAIITRDVLPLFRDLIESDAYEEIRENRNSVAIGLREMNTAVGALTGMVDELDIFTVTSLYVLPSFRRHQGGTMLMYALTTLLENLGRGVALMSYVEGTGDFEMLPSFLESIGAYETDSLEKLYIGTVGALYEQFAFTKELGNSGVISFNDLAPGQQLQLTENNHVGDLRTLGGGLSGLVPSPFLSFLRVAF